MIRTYERTTTISNLEERTIKLYIYEDVKYRTSEEGKMVTYTGLKSWSIIDGEDAKEIESKTNDFDENHEYLVLNFTDGSTSTFRNSHVDMFLR